jgi:hypothetical protein
VRGRGPVGRWVARVGLALLAVTLMGLGAAAGAQAATPTKSIVPFMNCYWDNGNGTYTVSIGYNNKNATSQTLPIGTDNRFTSGNADRGQPKLFLTGVRNNVFVMTASAADVNNNLNWSLTGNVVSIQTPVKCSTKPVPLVGNMRALALSVLLLVGTALTVLVVRNRRHEVTG